MAGGKLLFKKIIFFRRKTIAQEEFVGALVY